jgi:hypothetical protein
MSINYCVTAPERIRELGKIVRYVITAGKEHVTAGIRGIEHECNKRGTVESGVFNWVRPRGYIARPIGKS